MVVFKGRRYALSKRLGANYTRQENNKNREILILMKDYAE